ncbi:MAG: hypothetical protein GY807_10185, partial [Gammaproteobacteria bacterium]|nr:hypothetical protein [Gammaproteobacteria bacterium]
EFTQVFTRLKALGPQINQLPDLKPEYQSLVERGNTIQTTIDRVTASINNVVHWFKNVFGMDGLSMARAGQLGALPLLPIAAISGAMALIGYWISDVYQFYQKLEKFDQLRAEGKSASEASRIVSELTDKPGLFNIGLGNVLLPILVIGGLWWFMRNKQL